MENKPKFLIIGPRGLFGCEGGIEKFSDEFVPRALKIANVDVLCIIKPDHDLPNGLKILHVPKSKKFKTDKALYLLYAIYFYSFRNYNHVFIFGTNFSILIPIFKIIFWRESKIHLRSGSIDYKLPKWGRITKKLLKLTESFCKYADTVIAVSPSIQKHLQSLNISSYLVRNGICIAKQNTIEKEREKNTVVAVGRVTSQKNYEVLLEASKILGEDSPNIYIIGGADLSDEAKRLKEICHNNDHIHFLGALNRSDVLSYLKTKSVYVNCSIHEGMSNAVLEAVQESIPVILSNIEANQDLMLPDKFYFDPNNPSSLALKLKEVLKTPKEYVVTPEIFDSWDDAVSKIFTIIGIKE